LQDEDVHACPRQQEAEHHPGRPAAGDAAAGVGLIRRGGRRHGSSLRGAVHSRVWLLFRAGALPVAADLLSPGTGQLENLAPRKTWPPTFLSAGAGKLESLPPRPDTACPRFSIRGHGGAAL